MKKHFEKHWLKYAFGIVIVASGLIFRLAYWPHFEHSFSGRNEDWGNFGAFFWGFGTMCFTLINLLIFHQIEQRIYRKQMYDTYRMVLEKIIYNLHTKTLTNEDYINMISVLGGIAYDSAYSNEVQDEAAKLITDCNNYKNNSSNDGFANVVTDLVMFQICLITNSNPKNEETNDNK